MPLFHAHRRRVPTQDVDRSIVVGMGAKAAAATGKDRLAFAALPVHGCALRTGLRAIGWIDGDEIAAAFFQLVGEQGSERRPALAQYRPLQAGFLAHPAARLINRAFRRGHHVFDLQVFQHGRAEAAGNVSRDTTQPVAANAAGFTISTLRTPGSLMMAFPSAWKNNATRSRWSR
jgi:hypothetical protein